jgi:hypothetical protein
MSWLSKSMNVFGCFLLAICLLFSGGCVKNMAIDALGNALGSGGGVYASDDDPIFVGDASAFGLKTIETLLAARPEHQKLLLAAVQGFTQYAYAYLQTEADYIEDTEFKRAQSQRKRAWRMYLRARRYGVQGLNLVVPQGYESLKTNPENVQRYDREHVGLMFWTAAATAAAVAINKDDVKTAADLDLVQVLVKRALELEPTYGAGALYDFMISWDGARPDAAGGSTVRAEEHFENAVKASNGKRVAPKLAFAESVCVRTQDKQRFIKLLKEVIVFDADTAPKYRMANLIAQRRAYWLLTQLDNLFI